MSSEKIIVLYERLSREDENLGESYSISNQKKLLEDYCREKGWTRFRHFTDDGISGTTFERPSFKEMINLVEDGEADRLQENLALIGSYPSTQSFPLLHLLQG